MKLLKTLAFFAALLAPVACVEPTLTSAPSAAAVTPLWTDYANARHYATTDSQQQGAVATVHPLATQAGIAALERGGNAIDAAVAAALTLGVVDSHNSGIGGGNFAVVHYADGRLEAIDGREMAPAAAHRDMYLRDGKADGSLSKTGALAIGVPGSLAVYDYLLKSAGKLSLKQLILPAARLAEQGAPLAPVSQQRIARVADSMGQFPATAAIFLDAEGKPWPVGHHLIQKDLANTYRQIASKGIDHFYKGEYAKKLAAWMQANGGILRYQDFANYQLRLRQPVLSDYRGYQIVGFPPPSSGGVHVAQILNILENFDIATLAAADRYHLLAEAMRRAFADRAHFLGDPDFVNVPKGLIDPQYAKQLAEQIDLAGVDKTVEHGQPPAADSDFFGKHTTHISAADQWGNWVSITTTINTTFGSKVVVPGTGVVLNNQMDDFSIQPGVPNAFGLLGKEANSVQPGKRPLSSMSPTIVVKDGKPIIAIGAAGGPTIITQVVQGLVNMIDLGMPVQQALATPRIHQQWRPLRTFVEEALADPVKQSLVQRGHDLQLRPTMGASQAIRQVGEVFEAAAEPRIIEKNRNN